MMFHKLQWITIRFLPIRTNKDVQFNNIDILADSIVQAIFLWTRDFWRLLFLAWGTSLCTKYL